MRNSFLPFAEVLTLEVEPRRMPSTEKRWNKSSLIPPSLPSAPPPTTELLTEQGREGGKTEEGKMETHGMSLACKVHKSEMFHKACCFCQDTVSKLGIFFICTKVD